MNATDMNDMSDIPDIDTFFARARRGLDPMTGLRPGLKEEIDRSKRREEKELRQKLFKSEARKQRKARNK